MCSVVIWPGHFARGIRGAMRKPNYVRAATSPWCSGGCNAKRKLGLDAVLISPWLAS